MEKGTSHYRLDAIKAVVAVGGMKAFTITAERGVVALKISHQEAIGVVLTLTPAHFYKSMTTYADHRVWQDVYHAPCPNGRAAYIKLTLRDDGVVVIQFKEL
jgi:motility quorum-sensing regulator/GCU-specific mRNA interferase toxin